MDEEVMRIDLLYPEAWAFVCERHAGQECEGSRAPYAVHCATVAQLLWNHGERDAHILVAALLHDVVEETATTIFDVKSHFGERVARIVQSVSHSAQDSREAHDILVAQIANSIPEAQRIELVDHLHTLCEGLFWWEFPRIEEYRCWSRDLLDAIPRQVDPALWERLNLLAQMTPCIA